MGRHVFGYKPEFGAVMMRRLCVFIAKALGLNGKSKFSNEFIQQLDPQYEVTWRTKDGVFPLRFRTGHGRLLWRAKTLLTEEPLMMEWLSEFKPSDVFLDIGANVGTYTIPAACVAGKVYACELDPMNVGILQENLFLNGRTDKVIIFPFPCGDQKTVNKIYYRDFSKGDALQSVGRESPFNTRTGRAYHASQLTFPIDAVIKEFGLEWPNKIKIDVDGNERIVIAGAREAIRNATEIYMECADDPDSAWAASELLAAGFREARRREVAGVADAFNVIFRRET